MFTSSFAVYLLYMLLGDGEVALKIAVDGVLFIVSFLIQRIWVFKMHDEEIGEMGLSDSCLPDFFITFSLISWLGMLVHTTPFMRNQM
ncbi:hypothetical protein [Halalkalibacter akibai]|uniref:hypothetical protein n=1 Tax=Halalkalibacter akibai TaxID=1411 RepID=UPI000552E872|nr:hypothetical protein [Halalkalibacter akibai]